MAKAEKKAKTDELTLLHSRAVEEEREVRPITTADVAAWIPRCQGNVSAIADALSVSRTTIYNRIHEDDSLRVLLLAERERTLDSLEETLATQALNGSIPALIFALKTQGRSRGYGDKVEVEGWIEKADRSAGEDAAYLAEVLTELKKLANPKPAAELEAGS